MPVPNLITDLSATPASNSPVGSVDVPSSIDDYQRTHAAFIRQLLDANISNVYTSYTTAGSGAAYTITPSPAITAYAAGQSFWLTFHAASGAAPTLQISGIATPPTLVKQISDGTYANVAANDIPVNHRGEVTLLSATQARVTLPAAKSGANSDITSLTALASINGGQLAGLRNRIINGNPLVNQRAAAAASAAYAAGVYILDRWKAGVGGVTLSFATVANVVTITITAGTLVQVVEGNNLQSGTHILSWSGTAQGRIDAGSYGASGVTGAATGGTNLSVEFNIGTLSLAQLEVGTVATPFEHRSVGAELALCQRYYEKSRVYFSGATADNSRIIQTWSFKATKRTTPTVTKTDLTGVVEISTITDESVRLDNIQAGIQSEALVFAVSEL